MDGAVVLIDSVEGVEAQTQGVWSQLDRYVADQIHRDVCAQGTFRQI